MPTKSVFLRAQGRLFNTPRHELLFTLRKFLTLFFISQYIFTRLEKGPKRTNHQRLPGCTRFPLPATKGTRVLVLLLPCFHTYNNNNNITPPQSWSSTTSSSSTSSSTSSSSSSSIFSQLSAEGPLKPPTSFGTRTCRRIWYERNTLFKKDIK